MDTSNELILQRHDNGVKLVKPHSQLTHENFQNQLSVGALFQFPFNIYFNDLDGVIQNTNETTASCWDFLSREDIIGKSAWDVGTKETAHLHITNQRSATLTNKINVVDEEFITIKHNEFFQSLSFLLPWYNEDNKIIGVFGTSIILGKQPASDALVLLSQLGILNLPNTYQNNLYAEKKCPANLFYFSNREKQCANLVMQGKTAKEIALILALSRRTVEHYIESIKHKMAVKTKSELITKIHLMAH